jgi:hypothetical protein
MAKGHKRHGVPRDSKGRIERRYYDGNDMTAREARSVAIQARVRVFGISPELASIDAQVNAGSVIGRMRLQGSLTADQWDALDWWLRQRDAYLRAILAKREGSSGAGPGNGGEDTDGYAEWCEDKIKLWDEIRDVIQDMANETRAQLFAALDYIAVKDIYLPHLEGPLRYAANAIHRRFLQGRR